MKRNYVIAAVLAILLAGCAVQQSKIEFLGQSTPEVRKGPPPAGLVTAYLELSTWGGEVPANGFMFAGRKSVRVVPDGKTGGWKYSRPAFAKFRIIPSYGGFRTILCVDLPRNSDFIVVVRKENIWGEGEPQFIYFWTGGDQFAARLPNGQTGGAYIFLSPQPPPRPGIRLPINAVIDTAPVTDWLMYSIMRTIYMN